MQFAIAGSDNKLYTGGGNDTVYLSVGGLSGPGGNHVELGNGNDSIYVTGTNVSTWDQILLGAGQDHVGIQAASGYEFYGGGGNATFDIQAGSSAILLHAHSDPYGTSMGGTDTYIFHPGGMDGNNILGFDPGDQIQLQGFTGPVTQRVQSASYGGYTSEVVFTAGSESLYILGPTAPLAPLNSTNSLWG